MQKVVQAVSHVLCTHFFSLYHFYVQLHGHVLTSALSLELFKELSEGDMNFEFRDFPRSFRSMFQIMTQESWLDVKNEVLNRIDEAYLRFLAEVYFMIYHFLATMVIVSMFVALILDNLELTEDSKRKRQLKMATGGVDTQERIPFRYAIFKKFPDNPEMVKIKNNLQSWCANSRMPIG